MKKLTIFLVTALLCLPLTFSCVNEPQEELPDQTTVGTRAADSNDIWGDFAQRVAAYEQKTYPDSKAEETRHKSMYAAAIGHTMGSHQSFIWDLFSGYWFGWSALCDASLSTRAAGDETDYEYLIQSVTQTAANLGINTALPSSHDAAINSPQNLSQMGGDLIREIYSILKEDNLYEFDQTPLSYRKARLLAVMELYGATSADIEVAENEIDSLTCEVMEILEFQWNNRNHISNKPYLPCFTHLDPWMQYYDRNYSPGDFEYDIAELVDYIFPVLAAETSLRSRGLLGALSTDHFNTTELGNKRDFHRLMMGLYNALEFSTGFEAPFSGMLTINNANREISGSARTVSFNVTTNTSWSVHPMLPENVASPEGLTLLSPRSGTGSFELKVQVPKNTTVGRIDYRIVILYSSTGSETYDRGEFAYISQEPLPLFQTEYLRSSYPHLPGKHAISLVPSRDATWTVQTADNNWFRIVSLEIDPVDISPGHFLIEMQDNTGGSERSATFYAYYHDNPSKKFPITLTQRGGNEYRLSSYYITQNYNPSNRTISFPEIPLQQPGLTYFHEFQVSYAEQISNSAPNRNWVTATKKDYRSVEVDIIGSMLSTTEPNRTATFRINLYPSIRHLSTIAPHNPFTDQEGIYTSFRVIQSHSQTTPPPPLDPSDPYPPIIVW